MAEPLYDPRVPMPEQLPPARKSSWPAVLGTFLIIFGVLGSVCGVLMGLMSMNFTKMLEQVKPLTPEQAEFMASGLMRTWSTITTTYLFIGATLALLALFCGIGLLMRRRWAVRLATTWAGLKIVLEIASTIGGIIVHQKIVQAIDSGAVDVEAVPELFRKFSVLPVVVQLIFWLTLPVITLLWLSRRETQEEVGRWS